MVRKAIFDILGPAIEDSKVLELFAGSGAVGIEAFSQGAAEVTFVDNDVHCLKVIEANLRALGLGLPDSNTKGRPFYRIWKRDSLEAIDFLVKEGLSFDFIFLDPPYRQDLAKKSLLKLGAHDTILQPLGLLVLEHYTKEKLPETQGGLMLYKQKKYGETALSFYKRT